MTGPFDDIDAKAKELLTSRGWQVGWHPKVGPFGEEVVWIAARGVERVEGRSLGELVEQLKPWLEPVPVLRD